MLYKVVVPGKPVPKERPRLSKQGKMYTPDKTKKYEELIRKTAYLIIDQPLTGHVSVDIKIYTWRLTGDIDNYIKSILDGLTGVAYKNDLQVTALSAKRYISDIERVEIDITEDKREL